MDRPLWPHVVDPRDLGPGPATRTLLELVAELMEASFKAMGEGVILATLPQYLQTFGTDNARYVRRHFLGAGKVRGPRGALSAMDLVSEVTGTSYTVLEQHGCAVKRLHACEFQPAFKDRGDFPRAMMCMLHRASYQGSVDAMVDDDGFDVDLRSRILFGDDHCDFMVCGQDAPDGPDEPLPIERQPSDEERDDLSFAFYTFLLTSFVDYMTHHLPEEEVGAVMRRCADRVGDKAAALMEEEGLLGATAHEAACNSLRLGGRRLDDGADDEVRVAACPQAEHIRATSKGGSRERLEQVRANACLLCTQVVGCAAGRVDGKTRTERLSSLALGDADCRFRLRRDDG